MAVDLSICFGTKPITKSLQQQSHKVGFKWNVLYHMCNKKRLSWPAGPVLKFQTQSGNPIAKGPSTNNFCHA